MNQVNNKINQVKLQGVMAMITASKMTAAQSIQLIYPQIAVVSGDADKFYNARNPADVKQKYTGELNFSGMTSKEVAHVILVLETLQKELVELENEAATYMGNTPTLIDPKANPVEHTDEIGVAPAQEGVRDYTARTLTETAEALVKRDPNTIKPNEFVRTSDETPEPKQQASGPVIMGKGNDE